MNYSNFQIQGTLQGMHSKPSSMSLTPVSLEWNGQLNVTNHQRKSHAGPPSSQVWRQANRKLIFKYYWPCTQFQKKLPVNYPCSLYSTWTKSPCFSHVWPTVALRCQPTDQRSGLGLSQPVCTMCRLAGHSWSHCKEVQQQVLATSCCHATWSCPTMPLRTLKAFLSMTATWKPNGWRKHTAGFEFHNILGELRTTQHWH